MQLSARPTPVVFRIAFAQMVWYASLGAGLYSLWSIVPFLGGKTDSWLLTLAHRVAALMVKVISPGNTADLWQLMLMSFDAYLFGAMFLLLAAILVWQAGLEISSAVWKESDESEWGLFLPRLLAYFGYGKRARYVPAGRSNESDGRSVT
ncbi:hypothetical protein QYH69_23985 [Paraburkholderia sp. SARCC-3016]|uniref:hypothetical protein n=1 Tax=Paraburkholderia sp. SARCC-3016 TaxID=3058611 RepID=UPI0028084549|nr:hypothetical protein [Paraburkholderia sp. SARCC-3016]MDQ7980303.1 hypothetical protein [Paraburkholderia sp. SARCC-3016]